MIEDNKDLVRDPKAGFLKNTNKAAYLTFVKERDRKTNEKDKIQTLERSVNDLTAKVDEILRILKNGS